MNAPTPKPPRREADPYDPRINAIVAILERRLDIEEAAERAAATPQPESQP